MHDATERPEAIVVGTVKLVGTDVTKITAGICELMDNTEAYQAMSFSHNFYGEGKACRRIVDVLN